MMGGSQMCSFTAILQCFVVLWLAWHIKSAFGYSNFRTFKEIYSKNPPMSIADGTPIWKYTINKHKTDAYIVDLVTVDNLSGVLSFHRHGGLQCKYLLSKGTSMLVVINAKYESKSGMSVLIQLTYQLPVKKCTEYYIVDCDHLHRMSIHVSLPDRHCTDGQQSNTRENPLQSVLPKVLLDCKCESIGENHLFDVSDDGFRIHVNELCAMETRLLKTNVKLTCPLVPGLTSVKLIASTHDEHSRHKLHEKYHNSTNRLKRQTTNTPPTFPQKQYVRSVLEEQSAGYLIDTFSAVDPDVGSAGEIRYSLVATRDDRSQAMFAVNARDGRLTTTTVLDREAMAAHYFNIIATDEGSPPLQAVAVLTVIVEDINDHTPTFESSVYRHAVSEAVGVGSTILTLRARDDDYDKNGELQYSLAGADLIQTTFAVDPNMGSIKTLIPLDREQHSYYSILVKVTDKAPTNERKSATATVELTIVDENDNYPQFTKSSYTVDVSEDIDVKGRPIIGEIKATDADSGANGNVKYSIAGGNDHATFGLDPLSGQLSVLRPIDYDSVAKNYFLRIRAQDGGAPPKSNTTEVVVRVVDVNDNDPHFYASHYHEAVMEDVPRGTTIMKVQAYDIDDGLNGKAGLLYSLRGAGADPPVRIDRGSGAVVTTRALDRETEAAYSLVVEARDQGDPVRSATAQIDISVRDVNDNAPYFPQKEYVVEVSEEAVSGSTVATVAATDADADENARLAYSITAGNTRGAFTVITVVGQALITLNEQLNYKDQNVYVLSVTARDRGGLSDTATVIVNVIDANNFRPTFTGSHPYKVSVLEDAPVGFSVFQVVAEDGDVGNNAKITYSLSDTSVFQIHPDSGDVTVTAELDRETVAGYTVSVTATDHGHPAKSDTTDLEIVIADVNDNAPKFSSSAYSAKVYEDAFVTEKVLVLEATDADAGNNGRVRYTFEGGDSGGGDFMVNPISGELRIARSLDHEHTASYSLVAYAVDRGSPERSTAVSINIQVIDVNDNAPAFIAGSEIHASVLENSPVGTTVTPPIEATDPDAGKNAVVEYSLVGGPDVAAFSLVTSSHGAAHLTTLTELDYESGKILYEVHVRAASGPFFKQAVVYVHVNDTNDNAPRLEDFTVVVNNFPQHWPQQGVVGRVPAVDPDVSDSLTYTVAAGNSAGLVTVGRNNGLISLDGRLDSDVATNGSMEIVVSDGVNAARAVCRLTVRLVTPAMLVSAVTVRIPGLPSAAAFLAAPLYDMFTAAVATVVPAAASSHVIVVDVQDQPGVPEVNVTFCVRSSASSLFPPAYVRERVFLQRALLARLSGLPAVRPFDDALCAREPCLNYERCSAVQRFAATAPLASDSMLFRALRTAPSFTCDCPDGFTGGKQEYLCDTEVNLCYSSPCQHNGTCVPRESGFTCVCPPGVTGARCEVPRATKLTACPAGACAASAARCEPLIRAGFRCEADDGTDCASLPDRLPSCALTTRHFPLPASELTFPALRQRHRLTLTLEFATRRLNGRLVHNARYDDTDDFLTIEIVDGEVWVRFSLGGSSLAVVGPVSVPGGVSDGRWRRLELSYLNRTATLALGDCDTEVAIAYPRLGDRCAQRARLTLPSRCSDVTETCHRFLDLTGPLRLGGGGFVGCLRHINVDGTMLDLADSVWQTGTQPGCAPLSTSACSTSPCAAGACHESWGTFRCVCPARLSGRRCQTKDTAAGWQLTAGSEISFPAETPRGDITASLEFRSEASAGDLLTLGPVKVTVSARRLEAMVTGGQSALLDVAVTDGRWHHAAVSLTGGQLTLALDHGVAEMTEDDISENDIDDEDEIGEIKIGGGDFHGCVRDVRVADSPRPLADPATTPGGGGGGVTPGCGLPTSDPCDSETACPTGRACLRVNSTHRTCLCESRGLRGPECRHVCDAYNPCGARGVCVRDAERGYTCRCHEGWTGEYCEVAPVGSCPDAWYSAGEGAPCGPCRCHRDKGFDPRCNQTTGACTCREHHYPAPGGASCLPCACDSVGAVSPACAASGGQCRCQPGVLGRRCDQCSSRFAEVTVRGCEVLYDACPRSHAAGVVWPRTPLGAPAAVTCPVGSAGVATRRCDPDVGWQQPDLFNCTGLRFVKLRDALQRIESGADELDTNAAKRMAEELSTACVEAETLYGQDVDITARLVTRLLRREATLSGLALTHAQDARFVSRLVSAASRVTDASMATSWAAIHRGRPHAAASLAESLEEYARVVAANLRPLFMPPFDVVTENIVFGVDFLEASENASAVVPIPKYNNKVLPASPLFDPVSHAVLPAPPVTTATGYVLHRSLGALLPTTFDPASVPNFPPGIPVQVNSPVFSLTIAPGNTTWTPGAVTVDLRQLERHNRSAPVCVWWERCRGWSGAGCSLLRLAPAGDVAVCRCDHLTAFAVLTAVTEGGELREYMHGRLEIVTYVLLSVSLCLLLSALLSLCLLRPLRSNAHTVHLNLALSLLLHLAVFAAAAGGVAVDPLACRAVAILAHFFCLAGFAWLLVATIHTYRQLTELRPVDTGPMPWYYVVGYVFPGIVVSLSVGLHTGSFGGGGSAVCWVRADDALVWSVAAPALAAVTAGAVLTALGFRVSCNSKLSGDPEVLSARRRGQTSSLLLLLLPGCAGLGLLLTVTPALTPQYVLAAFWLLAGAVMLAGYVLLSKQTRSELRLVWGRQRGGDPGAANSLDDALHTTAGGRCNKSSLVYDRGGDSSLEGGLHRIHVGMSTESTTSRSSTDKSHHAMFPGAAPVYGFNPAAASPAVAKSPAGGKKSVRIAAMPPGDGSDSDSELSAMEHPDLADLASSIDSDSEDDDRYAAAGAGATWKNKHAGGGEVMAPPQRVDSLPDRELQAIDI